MNSLNKNVVAIAAAAVLVPVCGPAWSAVPTSGAYVTDVQNTWVQDRVGDRISTVNMIMCVMGGLRPDAMVNAGPYVALVDKTKCSGRSDSSQADSTSAGQSNATNYMNAIVDSTQASSSAPLTMKAWITANMDGGQKMLISVYGVATAGKSAAYPNGLFTINYCGQQAGADPLSPCHMRGMLRSDDSGLSFYESEAGGAETKLILQANSQDVGGGQMSGVDGAPYQYKFAYDTNNFRRSDGSVDACFSRDKANAEYSTWRYGTYNQDGSRLNLSNPGFPVKYVNGSETYHGFWSFWGLWLPDTALTTVGSTGTLSRRVGNADQTLSVVKKGGKLWKLTRQDSTLTAFKNIPMMFWAPANIGSQLQAGSNYELQWDGTDLRATRRQVCSPSGCQQQAISPAVALQASDFWTAGVRVMQVFFPSGGGNGAVRVDPTAPFSSSTVLSLRVRSVVTPGASDAPSSLVCLGGCPKAGAALTAAFSGGAPAPFLSQSWAPVLAGSATAYGYSNGMLRSGGSDVDGSGITENMLQYSGGIVSGSMVSSTDLSAVSCDAGGAQNPSGAYLCPYLADRADVVYQWETGPNKWNQFFGATGVTIDPPKSLSFAVTSGNVRAANPALFAGNTLQLQFSGFGELQGIPGRCVNPDTYAPTQCVQGARYVPAFDIVDGSVVSEGSTNYYVKFLERELRLSKLSGSDATACKAALPLPVGLTLPGPSSLTVNPVTTIGTTPAVSNPKPAVIDGIVQ